MTTQRRSKDRAAGCAASPSATGVFDLATRESYSGAFARVSAVYCTRRGQDEQDSHGRSPGLWTGDAAIEFTRWRIHILWLPAGGCSGFAWVDEPSRWWRARNPFFSRTHFSAFAQNLPLTLHEAMTGKPKKSAESGSH